MTMFTVVESTQSELGSGPGWWSERPLRWLVWNGWDDALCDVQFNSLDEACRYAAEREWSRQGGNADAVGQTRTALPPELPGELRRSVRMVAGISGLVLIALVVFITCADTFGSPQASAAQITQVYAGGAFAVAAITGAVVCLYVASRQERPEGSPTSATPTSPLPTQPETAPAAERPAER